MNEPKLLTIEEAAATAAMNRRTFRRRLSEGTATAFSWHAFYKIASVVLKNGLVCGGVTAQQCWAA